MGIPRLVSILTPFASRVPFTGRAVIDGPALAYHILDVCRQGKHLTGPHDEPPYSHLGQTAIQWLDQLRASGIDV